jgi:hypothetical protein
VDARARQVFDRHIPRLRKININPAVTLDTMQDCVGNIMYERDMKVEELGPPPRAYWDASARGS